MSYEIGRIYVWQNRAEILAYLNGVETTVLGPVQDIRGVFSGNHCFAQPTDTIVSHDGRAFRLCALPGDLRPKTDPIGERRVMDMFKTTKLERA